MFRLLQIQVPREEFDAVNEMGWTAAAEKFPKVEAHLAVTSGSDGFVDSYMSLYTHVSDIYVETPEQAFHTHNNPYGSQEEEDKIVRYERQHSMSVGDILIGPNDEVLFCDNMGFVQMLSATYNLYRSPTYREQRTAV